MQNLSCSQFEYFLCSIFLVKLITQSYYFDLKFDDFVDALSPVIVFHIICPTDGPDPHTLMHTARGDKYTVHREHPAPLAIVDIILVLLCKIVVCASKCEWLLQDEQ